MKSAGIQADVPPKTVLDDELLARESSAFEWEWIGSFISRRARNYSAHP